MKRNGLVALALFLVIILWGGVFLTTASSQPVDSRFYNLEADFNRLESRVSRIEALLGQTGRSPSAGRSPSPSRTPATSPPSTSRRSVSPQEREKMFDRLATLVVELKQQVNKLEERVAKLEKR